MLPNQQFSENIGPPWTPPVWDLGPDGLVAQARQALFGDSTDLVDGVLNSSTGAMAGHQTAPNNDAELYIDTDHPDNKGRGAAWRSELNTLRADEPMPDGPINPSA